MIDLDELSEYLSNYIIEQKLRITDLILVQDSFFCLPSEITNRTILITNNHHFCIISHKNPVERDFLILSIRKERNINNFLIVYDSENDELLGEYKRNNINLKLSPDSIISNWLNTENKLDPSVNYFSKFIWNSKEFILQNRERIFNLKSLTEKNKFREIIELILNHSINDLIKKGLLIELFDDKALPILKSLFKHETYILEDLFHYFRQNLREVGVDDEILNIIEYFSNNINYNTVLRIFLAANLLNSIGKEIITIANFNCFLEEISQNVIKIEFNRLQILFLANITKNYIDNLSDEKIIKKLILQSKLIGQLVIKKTKIKEFTINSFIVKASDPLLYCLKLSELTFFYYSPLIIMNRIFETIKVNEELIDGSFEIKRVEEIGKLHKMYKNLESNSFFLNKSFPDKNYNNLVLLCKTLLKLIEKLNIINYHVKSNMINWNYNSWIDFYCRIYTNFVEKIDKLDRIQINGKTPKRIKKDIGKWIINKQTKTYKDISKNYLEFVRKNYPKWVKNPTIAPTLSTNILKRKIFKYFKRSNLALNFIILIDGCSVVNWNIIESNIRKDFLDKRLEIQYGFSIIPSKTIYSRKSIFTGTFPTMNGFFSIAESNAFLAQLEQVNNIRLRIGRNHDCFFNTHCELDEKFNLVLENISNESYPQIMIFNFSDILNEQFDRKDVIEIINNTFYFKIKRLIEHIFNKNVKSNIFFITDHGIINADKKIGNISFVNQNNQKFNLSNLRRQYPECKISPRNVQLNHKLQLNRDIEESIRKRFLYIENTQKFGLDDKYNPFLIASSSYSFRKKQKSHGGISMFEMIIPFARLYNATSTELELEDSIIEITNKNDFVESKVNFLNLKINNKNLKEFYKIRIEFITQLSHQIKVISNLNNNDPIEISFLCNDKGLIELLIFFRYEFKNEEYTQNKAFTLYKENYQESLSSKSDELLDEEI